MNDSELIKSLTNQRDMLLDALFDLININKGGVILNRSGYTDIDAINAVVIVEQMQNEIL